MIRNTELSLLFKDAGDFLEIEPLRLSYPDSSLTEDRNWIMTSVKVKASVFAGAFETEIRTIDFEVFNRQLKILSDDLKSSAHLANIDDELILKIKGDGLGHLEIKCTSKPGEFNAPSLEFTLTLDQTELPVLISKLDKITKAFPIIGGDYSV